MPRATCPMRTSVILLVACLSISFLSARPSQADDLSREEREYLSQKGVVVFISQTQYPPFEFIGSDGDRTGMCIELARWIATRFGFKTRFVDTSFKEAQEAVLSGKADVLTSLFYSQKRDQTFGFTQEMFQVPASIFVVANRPDIKSLEDLQGMTIAMQSGDYAQEFLASKGIKFKVAWTKNFAEATDLVIAGQADAIIGDEQIVLYHVYSNRLNKFIKKVGEPLYIGQNCMAVRKGNNLLLSILHKGIALAQETGTLDRINTTWLGVEYKVGEPFLSRHWRYFMAAGALLLLIAALVWIWNLRLRSVVAQRTESLRKSETQFRFLAEAMADIVWTSDMNFQATYVSPSVERVLGFTSEERTRQSVQEMVTPDSIQRIMERLAQEFAFDAAGADPERTVKMEVEYYRKDGSTLWMENVVRAIRDAKGEITGLHGVSRDISERKEAEKRVAELAAIVASSKESIIGMDMTGVITSWNQGAEDLYGYSAAEALGSHVSILIPEGHHDLEMDYLKTVAAGEVLEQYETTRVAKDGILLDLSLTMSPLLDDSGQQNGVSAIARDIGPRKRAEEALRQSEAFLDSIVENLPSMIFIKDARDLRFVRFNKAGEELLGYSRQELLGKNDYDFFPREEADFFTGKDREVLNSAMLLDIPEEPIQTRLQGERVLHTRKIPLLDQNGTPKYLLGISEDITARRQTEQAYRSNSDFLTRLVETASEGVSVCQACDEFPYIRFALWNDRMTEMTGYTMEEINRLGWYQSMYPDPDLQAKAVARMERMRDGDNLKGEEWPITTKEGEKRTLAISTSVMQQLEDGSPAVVGLMQDITTRQQAEEALRQSEENFRTFFESMTDLVVVGTPEGQIVYTNKAYERKLGYSDNELATMHVLDFHPANLRKDAEDIFAAMFRGERADCPLPLARKDGSLVPADTRAWFGTWSGKHCIFGISKDLSAELEAQQLFERLFRNNPALMALTTVPDRRFYDVNDAFLKTLGYNKYEVIGKTSAEIGLFVSPEQQSALAERLKRQGHVADYELLVRHKDGAILNGLFSGDMIDTQGQQYFLTVMIDITERKRAEDALRASEERLQAAIEAIDEGFVIYGTDDRLAMCNHKYIDLYKESADLIKVGASFEEIIRRGVFRGQYAEAVGKEDEWIADRLAQHRAGRASFEQKLPGGRWLRISERKTKSGSTVGFRVDISALKQTQESLERALAERETLLKEIHHRVKNNLAVASSLLRLQSRAARDPVLSEGLRDAESRLKAMALVHETLYQSRNLASIDLGAFLRKLTAALRQTYSAEARGPLAINVEAEGLVVDIDQASPLGLVINELLTNSFKYAFPDGRPGKMSITAKKTGQDRLTVLVADDGVGLPQDFVWGDQNTLGLGLVKDLIESQLMGSIEVGPGPGVRFTIQVPS